MDVLFFGSLAVVFSFGAIIARSTRAIFWLLWLSGLALGCTYLSIGSDFLAFIQVLLVTVSGVLYFFFGFLHSHQSRAVEPRKFIVSLLLGLVFLALLGFGFSGHALFSVLPNSNLGLVQLGQYLVGHQFLSLELMGILLFVVIIGVGVLARR